MTALVAGLLSALALLLLLPRRPRVGAGLGHRAPERVDESAAEQGLLLRLRAPLVLLAALGGWLFFGGWLGVIAGLGLAIASWRILGGVESPAAIRRRERLADELPASVDLLVAALGAGSSPEQGCDWWPRRWAVRCGRS